MIVLAGGGVLQSSKQSETPVIKLEPAQIYRVVEKCERPERKAYKIYTLYKSMHTIPCMHVLPRNRNDDDGACWRGRTPVVRTIKHECMPSELPVLRAYQRVMSSSTWRAKTPQRRSKSAAKAPQTRSKDAAKTPQRRSKGATKGAVKAPQKRCKSVAQTP